MEGFSRSPRTRFRQERVAGQAIFPKVSRIKPWDRISVRIMIMNVYCYGDFVVVVALLGAMRRVDKIGGIKRTDRGKYC